MASQLAQDIEAIAIAADCISYDVPVHLGVVEGDGFEHAKIQAEPDGYDRTCGLLNVLSEGADPDSRIAIAFLEHSQSIHEGAWAAAAREFCDGNIAAVFVMEADQWVQTVGLQTWADPNAEPYRSVLERMDDGGKFDDIYCECIPVPFWDAGLPILYDESGILEHVSPRSEVLDLDPRLSFIDMSRTGDYGIAQARAGHAGMFPAYDYTHTEEGLHLAQSLATAKLQVLDTSCRRTLAQIEPDYDWSQDMMIPSGIEEFVLFMDKVLPACVDIEDLGCMGWKHEEVVGSRYAALLDMKEYPDLDRVGKAATRLRRGCELIEKAFKNNFVMFCPWNARTPDEMADALRHVVVLLGVEHQMDALDEGVPFEDVVT